MKGTLTFRMIGDAYTILDFSDVRSISFLQSDRSDRPELKTKIYVKYDDNTYDIWYSELELKWFTDLKI